jgi:hypothetical protein
MKKMSMKEQDKFVERIIMRTFTIYELWKTQVIPKHCSSSEANTNGRVDMITV